MLIAQITDSHIVEKNEHWLSEPATQTDKRLQKVISALNRLSPSVDAILFTGDLVDTATSAAYAHFKELTQELKAPLYIVPGNHDNREEMRRAFSHLCYIPKKGFLHYVIDEHPVRLIGLDTLVDEEVYGMLCEERLNWLEKTLSEEREREKPTLIFMHHPPIKTGVTLIDRIDCYGSENLEKLVKGHQGILRILAGHYHHQCIGSLGDKLCILSPSIAPVHHLSHPP